MTQLLQIFFTTILTTTTVVFTALLITIGLIGMRILFKHLKPTAKRPVSKENMKVDFIEEITNEIFLTWGNLAHTFLYAYIACLLLTVIN